MTIKEKMIEASDLFREKYILLNGEYKIKDYNKLEYSNREIFEYGMCHNSIGKVKHYVDIQKNEEKYYRNNDYIIFYITTEDGINQEINSDGRIILDYIKNANLFLTQEAIEKTIDDLIDVLKHGDIQTYKFKNHFIKPSESKEEELDYSFNIF